MKCYMCEKQLDDEEVYGQLHTEENGAFKSKSLCYKCYMKLRQLKKEGYA